MSTHDTAKHRSCFQADGDAIEVRQPEDAGEGRIRIRMPVSSTTEARDGEAFARERIDGFARQIEAGDIGVFLDHGRSGPGESRYSALSKVGYWDSPDVRDRDAGAELVADAVLMDPAELDADVGDLREALATLKAQAELGVPLASSVGWSEDTGDRDLPGGADLLEISIVGIPSDPVTTTASAEPAAMARAVSAASSDFDVATFVRELERESRNVVDVGGEEIDLTPPDRVQNAAALGLSKKDEFADAIGDCGTGTGEEMAQTILDDDLTADIMRNGGAVADSSPSTYLESHESDVDAEGTPSDWSEEDWTGGCAEVQQALWGFYAGWFADKEQEIETAMDDERNLDDPAFSEGDPVEWSSNDTTVRGRVADIGDEFVPAEGVTITGDEGEAVYLIHELDDSLEPPQYRRENVAKPESSLDDSQADLPPLDGNFADGDNSMTDNSNEPDGESGTDTDEQRADMEEMLSKMVDMQEEQTAMIREMYENGMDGDGEDDDDMDENAADADEADADGERETVPEELHDVVDAEEPTVDDVREHIQALREQADDAEVGDPETTDRGADDGDGSEATDSSGFGMAARVED